MSEAKRLRLGNMGSEPDRAGGPSGARMGPSAARSQTPKHNTTIDIVVAILGWRRAHSQIYRLGPRLNAFPSFPPSTSEVPQRWSSRLTNVGGWSLTHRFAGSRFLPLGAIADAPALTDQVIL